MAYNPYMSMAYPNMYMQYQSQNQGNGGNFISVPNENAARNYPIAPGNSITFIDENSPYCYTKTMGLNQLDRPVFKRYRLVEETETLQKEETVPCDDHYKAEIDDLRTLYEDLKLEIEVVKESMNNVKPHYAKTNTTKQADV